MTTTKKTSKKTSKSTSKAKGESKPKVTHKTDCKRHAIAVDAPAKEYLANGGTMQVLALAFLCACNNNKTEANAMLARAITITEQDYKEYYHEAGNYTGYAEKHQEKAEHRTYTEAEKLAKSFA